uniref:acyl-CoA--sterol O-acyltransferase 1-like n=1 Tax=Erigeron canadensis TaxID=72917 RepID=UPI001CB905DE|nr:acyl-CoA--sterol O-acyltransferase 1-like [Erigeron canadensis]
MNMEGEVNNFIVTWMVVFASLLYSYIIGKLIPKGTTRLLALSIVICLFLWFPLKLTTMHLGGLTSFFIAWLANFKILLFAYGKGPLASNPPLPLSRFIPTACLPIKPAYSTPSPASGPPTSSIKKTKKSVKFLLVKVVLFGLLLKAYDYGEYIHPHLKMSLYGFHIYFMLEIVLAMLAYVAGTLVEMQLEPQFDEPYLATSLQDFWGKRWNLMATNILHPTIYDPVRSISSHFLTRKQASIVAIFVTFLVSGLMHEFIFYNIGRLQPTGEVTCFFLLHGVLLSIEIAIKRAAKGQSYMPPILSRVLTLGCVLATAFWLFFPPFLRFTPIVRGCQETVAFLEFVINGRLISPVNASCPIILR